MKYIFNVHILLGDKQKFLVFSSLLTSGSNISGLRFFVHSVQCSYHLGIALKVKFLLIVDFLCINGEINGHIFLISFQNF